MTDATEETSIDEATAPDGREGQPAAAARGPAASPPAAARAAATRPRSATGHAKAAMKSMHIVEAALFSAGRAVSVEEIAQQEELSKKDVEKAIAALAKLYDERDTVLEIRKAGAKWGMQVRRQAAEPAAKFAPMEIPAKTLKTLALIAYHQPLKQSELVDMVGSKAYDHVGELHEHGLVKWRKEGQTKILTVTAAFPEYFGLDAATPGEIRRTLAKMVGLDPDQGRAPALERYEAAPQPPAAQDPGHDGAAEDPGADAAATPPLPAATVH